MKVYDVIIIGGGQSALATAYFLRRSGLRYLLLDKEKEAGGSWQHYWPSLRLFSPAQWSSLPGIIMEGGTDYYPTRDETIRYLKHYEEKYKLPLERGILVKSIEKDSTGVFHLHTSKGFFMARAVVSCTGSFAHPILPKLPGQHSFGGQILHSSQYKNPAEYVGKKVVVVGVGNSGAQILAELSKYTATVWVCNHEPAFLPDEVDGRVLFNSATALYKAKQEGRSYTPPSLGDIVMVPSVKKARERGALTAYPPITHFTEESVFLEDGRECEVDVVLFCTGFKPALHHLKNLGIVGSDRVNTIGTRAKNISGLWLVGYGNWTGFASATLIGVGRSARQTVKEIQGFLSSSI